MSNLVVSFIVRLVQQVTAPAKQIVGAVAGIAATATNAVKPVKAVGEALDKMKEPAEAAADSAKKTGDALHDTVKPAEDAGSAVDEAGKKAAGAGKRFGGLGGAIRLATAGLLAIDTVVLAHKAIIGSAIAGALLFTKSQADAADADARAATAADVAFQSYQKLKYAYRSNNLDVGILDGTLKGLIHSYGLALAGSKEQVAAFQALHVRLRDVNGHKRSTEDLFNAIADGMTRLKGSGRVNVATAIFGDNGPQLLEMLAKGSAGIKALTDRATQLHLVVSDDDLARAREFGDAWSHITDTLGGVRNSIWTGLLPSMTLLIKRIGQIIDQNREDILKVLRAAIEWLTRNLPAILKGLGDFVNFLKAIVTVGAKVFRALGGITTALALCGVVLAANVAVAIAGAVTGMISLAAAIWAAVPGVVAFTVALLANPLTWIVLSITAVIAALVWMAFHWKLVTKTLSAFWSWMREHFPVLTGVVQLFADMAGYVVAHWRDVMRFFSGLWTWMNAHHAWGPFLQPLIDIATGIVSHWSDVVKIFTTVWETLSSVFGKIANLWNSLPTPLKGFLAGAAANALGPIGSVLAPDAIYNATRGNAQSLSANATVRLIAPPGYQTQVDQMQSSPGWTFGVNRGPVVPVY